MARDARQRRTGLHAAALVLGVAASPAFAVLGGDAASVEADRLQMRATRQAAAPSLSGTVQEIRLADGSTIRQFVNARGIVYAVAWSTRVKPNLEQLLGQHAAPFAAEAASAARQPGLKRSFSMERGDLVVVSSGRPGAFVGRAWLKSQLPGGLTADAIR